MDRIILILKHPDRMVICMGLIDIASGNSVWRGMDYYKDKKVVSWEKTGPATYSGIVSGNGGAVYSSY